MSVDLAKEFFEDSESVDYLDVASISIGMDFLDFTRDPEGRLNVRIKRDMLSKMRRRVGVFIILTSLDDCAEALGMFRTRLGVLQDVTAFLDEIDGRRILEVSHRMTNGLLFIRYLGAMIRSGIRARLDGTGMDVDSALFAASSLSAVSSCGRVFTSRMEPHAESVLSMFGMEHFDLKEHMDRLSETERDDSRVVRTYQNHHTP